MAVFSDSAPFGTHSWPGGYDLYRANAMELAALASSDISGCYTPFYGNRNPLGWSKMDGLLKRIP